MSEKAGKSMYWRGIVWAALACTLTGMVWLAQVDVSHPLLLPMGFVSGLLLALSFYRAASPREQGLAPSTTTSLNSERSEPMSQGAQTQTLNTAALMDSSVPYDSLPAGLLTLNQQGFFLRANAAASQIVGVPRRLLLVHKWDDHFFSSDWDRLLKGLTQGPGRAEIEVEFEFDDGQLQEYRRASINATLNGENIEIFIQDITEKAKIRDYMEFLVRHDQLTKALNRMGIERHLKKRIDRMGDSGVLSLAYLDLDGFKMVNDLHGHQAGDELLIGVSRRIVELMPSNARLGRVGGDEFLMVFGGVDLQTAAQVCNYIVQSISVTPFPVQTTQVSVSGSVGLIEVKPGSALKEVIALADHACRQAKVEGKSRVVVHTRHDQSRLRHEGDLKLADDLASGDVLGHLGFQLQPILSVRDPEAKLDFEVLLLLADEHGDSVPAERFVNVAKNTGHMPKIDKWMLSTVLNWVRDNRPRLMHTENIFINLSGMSLNDSKFVEGVLGVMESFKDVAPLICVEVTEDVALKNLYKSRQFFLKLKEMGVRVALDDFGAGYTSFAYLRHLPSDFLKIDGSLISSINEDPANVSIVQGIVNMARSLGIKTIAEWAEDAACVRTLMEIGVDHIQGYAIARPMPADNLLLLQSSADPIADPSLRSMLAPITSGL